MSFWILGACFAPMRSFHPDPKPPSSHGLAPLHSQTGRLYLRPLVSTRNSSCRPPPCGFHKNHSTRAPRGTAPTPVSRYTSTQPPFTARSYGLTSTGLGTHRRLKNHWPGSTASRVTSTPLWVSCSSPPPWFWPD